MSADDLAAPWPPAVEFVGRHAIVTPLTVEIRTHFFNTPSRRAIERLGAKLDGILRNHSRMPDGTLRDTCVYSIIASEWPTVRRHLDWRLESESAGPD